MSGKHRIITGFLIVITVVVSLIYVNNVAGIFLPKFNASKVKVMNDEKCTELYSLGEKMMDIIIDENLVKVLSMTIGDQQRTSIKNAHIEFEIFNDDKVDLKLYK